ncbi:MAG TPA: XRE family transcriptional regulator [Nitrospirae bacterium]|nr:XRE family transcriptional regulator [Nitrospirota bacterium]HDZ01467.1 XRE family transcriptional regulator [Nitrospirota bacterium]
MKRNNIVGNNLRKTRMKLGLTQEEVALRSGLSQGYINQLESGKRMFTQKSLEQIAEALGISIADFFQKKKKLTGIREDSIEYNRKKPPSQKEIAALLSGLPPKLKEHYFSLLKLEKEMWGKLQS